MRFTSTLVVACLASLAVALPLQDTPQIAFSTDSTPTPTLTSSLLRSRTDIAAAVAALPLEHALQLEQHIASLSEEVRVRLGDDEEPITMTEGEKALLTLTGTRFVDVTNEQQFMTTTVQEVFPDKLSYSKKDLEPLFKRLDQSNMRKFLSSFTAFRTRYYRSDTGAQSQKFLLGQVEQIAASNKDLKIDVREFKHSWGQNSIIARFEPASEGGLEELKSNSTGGIVIIGAHQDSTNLLPFLGAPGADDDASGTTSILSAFKSLVESGFKPSHGPVEFHWYSAEEGGLLGSQAVAQDYAARGVDARSMLQMDMTAYVKPGTKPVIGIIQDFVSPDFTAYLTNVVGEYASIKSVETKCGYACSDHASWSKVGVPSAFTIESTFEDSDHNIHSSRDTIDQEGYSIEHIAEFAKVAIALAVELGGGASVVNA
ncbi:hypothetical protein JCM10908_000213 [Rhodotorula pacifica]|uniref:M28 family metallopeptidase n=1 Tax=Rhodotorula pacifica TaxID=1495444 RepID=UPI003175A089